MLSNRADSGGWAIVIPPCSLMARMPSAPSLPEPERMTPTARSPSSSASEAKKPSMGTRGASEASPSRSRPSASVRVLLGGMR